MSVIRVEASCECDWCGKGFVIELDLGIELKGGFNKDFEALARDTIIGGTAGYTWGIRGKATPDRYALSYQPTIQGGLMLCDVCSKKCDALPIEGNLTYAQVEHALKGVEHE